MKITITEPTQEPKRLTVADLKPGQVGITKFGQAIVKYDRVGIWLPNADGCYFEVSGIEPYKLPISRILPPGTKITLEVE